MKIDDRDNKRKQSRVGKQNAQTPESRLRIGRRSNGGIVMFHKVEIRIKIVIFLKLMKKEERVPEQISNSEASNDWGGRGGGGMRRFI